MSASGPSGPLVIISHSRKGWGGHIVFGVDLVGIAFCLCFNLRTIG